MSEILDSLPVRRVRRALAAKTIREVLHEVPPEAVGPEAAARIHGVDPAAVARVHIYEIGFVPVMVITAGDRRVAEAHLPAVFGLEGEVRRAEPARVEELTGFPPDGVAPVGGERPMAVAVDPSLGRFPRIFVHAGHPRVLMELSYEDLLHLTGGRPAPEVVEG